MTLLVGCGSYANASNLGQVTLEAGYRRDTINWRHRFPSSDPVASSNTRFKDLDIFQIGVHGRTTLGCNVYVRANAYWGWVLDGDYERSVGAYFSPDQSFGDDNFKFGFSDKNRSTIDDKYVFGIGAAIGYPFYFCDCTMILAPVLGYAFDEQNVRLEDRGFNFDNDSYGCFGSGDGCNNNCCSRTFVSRWYGPFVGLDFDYNPWNSCVNLWAELEYHWGSFKGKKNNFDGFNFFDDRNHSSHNATAWVFATGLDYDLCNCWTLGLSVKYQDWSANRHRKHNFSGDDYNEFSCCDRIRTNNKWRSYAINVTFGREF